MKLLNVLRETTIGRALLAYFFDLPRWTLLNLVFALALAPSLVAALRGETALAIALSFPAALAMAGLVGMFSATVDGTAPRWSHLWARSDIYLVTLSAWGACALAALALLTPLLYLVVIPALILLLVAPLATLVSAQLRGGVAQAWRNGFVLAVRYPLVALGLIVLALVAGWVILYSRGTLLVALPGLWAAIAVYTVDDLIQSIQQQKNAP